MPFGPGGGAPIVGIGNAITGGLSGSATDATRQVWQGVTDVAGLIAFVTDPRHLMRMAEIIGGGVLIGVGIYFLFASTETGAQVIETTGKAAGAAAKAAVAA